MAFDFELDVRGAEDVAKELGGISHRALHKRAAFEVIGDRFREHERELFRTEGGSGKSGRWRPRKGGGGRGRRSGRLLRESGRLERSLTQKGGDNIFNYNDERIYALGTRVPYASVHHEGGGVIPQRKLIDPTERQEDEYSHVLGEWIREGKT